MGEARDQHELSTSAAYGALYVWCNDIFCWRKLTYSGSALRSIGGRQRRNDIVDGKARRRILGFPLEQQRRQSQRNGQADQQDYCETTLRHDEVD